eukprot:ANDGO_01702.mRNA.1 hypothetical protein ABB37_10147
MVNCQDLLSREVRAYHVSRLRLYNADRTENPIEISGVDNDTYEVEKIVDHRVPASKKKRDYTFQVRWKGYGQEDDSWLPFEEVKDLEALDVYLRGHPKLRL